MSRRHAGGKMQLVVDMLEEVAERRVKAIKDELAPVYAAAKGAALTPTAKQKRVIARYQKMLAAYRIQYEAVKAAGLVVVGGGAYLPPEMNVEPSLEANKDIKRLREQEAERIATVRRTADDFLLKLVIGGKDAITQLEAFKEDIELL